MTSSTHGRDQFQACRAHAHRQLFARAGCHRIQHSRPDAARPGQGGCARWVYSPTPTSAAPSSALVFGTVGPPLHRPPKEPERGQIQGFETLLTSTSATPRNNLQIPVNGSCRRARKPQFQSKENKSVGALPIKMSHSLPYPKNFRAVATSDNPVDASNHPFTYQPLNVQPWIRGVPVQPLDQVAIDPLEIRRGRLYCFLDSGSM